MNTHYNHIIEKVHLEVNTSNIETANSIKNNISTFLNDELFPRLELLFDAYNIPGTVVRFDTLNINLSIDNVENMEHIKYEIYNELETKFKQQFELGTKNNLTKTDKNRSDVQKISHAKDLEATFFFFLENGYLPWYGKENYIVEFTARSNWKLKLKDGNFISYLSEIMQDKSVVIERFILQFPGELTISFLERINYSIATTSEQILKILTILKDNLRISYLRFLIKVSLFDEEEKWIPNLKSCYLTISENEKQLNRFAGFPFVSEFKAVVQQVVLENGIRDFLAFDTELVLEQDIGSVPLFEEIEFDIKIDKAESLFSEDETKEIAIQNAGLILFHPFYKNFFEQLGLLGDENEIRNEKKYIAVQSLHYLATGNENFFEGNLIFEKYLCGVPLKIPIPIESLLTGNIKEEATVLLKEVIRNWPELKNTSPDALRQMFINRDGKLIKSNNSCKLIVERKAQDVLLEKLQWNISIVKLPWKKELLFIEW